MLLISQGCRLLHMMMCPKPQNKNKVHGNIFTNMADEVADWVTAQGSLFQKNLGTCLGRELQNVIPLLLCQDKKSIESIAVMREAVLMPLCLDVVNLACKIALWVTEPAQVEYMVSYMGATHFCKKQRKVYVLNLDQFEQERGKVKRQYDLMSLYDVYKTIFCSKSQDLMYLDGYNEDSFDEMTAEMKRIVVILNFRRPVCCFALAND